MKTTRNRAGSVSYSGRAFTDTFTAIVTPFTESRKVDYGRLHRNIRAQITGGVAGIVPMGTTGESPTVSFEEHARVVAEAVKAAAGKVKVIAGTGANNTEEAVYLTKEAERAGADASLQVAPYYNKPTQEGVFEHNRVIAESTKLALILYNIPGRCGIDITVDTVVALRQACRNIVGIKVANGSMDYVTELRMRVGPDFAILSGDDSLTLPMKAVGADGVISVVSNVVPERVSAMVNLMNAGNTAAALEIHQALFPLVKAIFRENNPAGIKCAMQQLGFDSGVVKLPVVSVKAQTAMEIRTALAALGLLG